LCNRIVTTFTQLTFLIFCWLSLLAPFSSAEKLPFAPVETKLHHTSEKTLYSSETPIYEKVIKLPRGGGWLVPSGWNPFGYKVTVLGEEFLLYDGSLDSDVGRFLASLRTRKRHDVLKGQWLEVVRVAKTGQSMRVYRKLDELIQFCLKAGLID
jgi:hypothetical protein